MLVTSIPQSGSVSGAVGSTGGGFDWIRGLQLAIELVSNVAKLKDVTAKQPEPPIKESTNQMPTAPAAGHNPVIKSRCDHILEMIETILTDMVKSGRDKEKISDVLLSINPTVGELLAVLKAVK
jgi:hypothetical protein